MSYILKRNIQWLRNFTSGLINRSSTILAQIILIPIFINSWGKEYYGEWLLLSTLPAYLNASDLGLNVTATTAICSLVAQNKKAEAILIYQSANKALLYLTILGISIFSLSCYFFNWAALMGIKLLTQAEVEFCLFLLILSVFITFLLGLAIGIYRSEGRYDKSQNNITLLQLIDSIFILINIFLKGDILTVSISIVILRLLFLYVIIIDLKKKYSWFKFRFSNNIRNIFYLIPTSLYYMIALLGQGLVLQGTSFLIGKQLGSSTLVIFNTIRTLINSIKSFINIYYSSYLPEFTTLIATKKWSEAKNLFIRMFLVTFTISTCFVITYYALGDWILLIWTKGKIKLDHQFYLLMLFSIFFNTLGNCAYIVLNATNENRIIGIYYAIFAALAMVGIYYTIQNGLLNIAIILILIDFLMLIVTLKESWSILSGNKNIINH